MSSAQNKPILVLGGTGHYGRHIVRSLLEKDAPVRVLSRNAGNAREILGEVPEIVEGDITLRESIIEALNGVSAVVISVSAFAPKLIRKLRLIERDSVLMVLTEAERADVSRIVYISIYDIRQDIARRLDLESAEIKAEIENALALSNFNWTVLGAAPSTEIFFAMIRGDTMMVPGGGPPALPTVSPVDVGEIVAQTVLKYDLHGKRFRMVGPEAISFPEAAERISNITGKTIGFRKIPLLLPKIARVITAPLTPFSDAILYINQMLGFIQLLNQFPQNIIVEVPEVHRLLLGTFDYVPITLEMEAQRWGKRLR
ncbi:MAG: NAD(P)H-binding protein [Desulfobacteria bacterium]